MPKITDPDLVDTASSPGKEKDMDVDKREPINPLAKTSLDMNEHTTEVMENDEGNGNLTRGLPMITEDLANVGNFENEKDRNKRTKKDVADSPSLGSAGSFDGPVRSQ
jgi:hypothetical protein